MNQQNTQSTGPFARIDRKPIRRLATAAVFAVVASTTLAACDEGLTDPNAPPFQADRLMKVMTRNLYLGGDIGLVLSSPSPEQVPVRVGQVWASVTASDIQARAREIAREIAEEEPHVVGLQEAALFRVQAPGDFLAGNPVEATDVAYDYLAILMAELEALGQPYEVATSVENIDVELPAATSPTTFIDVRYTDRTVLLVHEDVDLHSAQSGNYAAAVQVPVAGAIPIEIPRGWNRAEISYKDQAWTVVNTHLETDETAPQIQELQATELAGQVASSELPTVVMGDLNGLPENDPGSTSTYATLIAAGFVDAWMEAPTPGSGYTCCFDPGLTEGELFERIDYVFVRGGSGFEPYILNTAIIGGDAEELAADGRHPSDHAGLLALIAEASENVD